MSSDHLPQLFLLHSPHWVIAQWPSSRNNLLTVCLSGWCFLAPFLKITFWVSHPIPALPSWLPQSGTAGLQLLQIEGLLRVILPPCLCCSCLELGLMLGWLGLTLRWSWAYVGLTVFIYRLVSRAISALVRALPDFRWHPSKGFLGCYSCRFAEV